MAVEAMGSQQRRAGQRVNVPIPPNSVARLRKPGEGEVCAIAS